MEKERSLASPVSARLKRYSEPYLSDSLKEIVTSNECDAIFVTYVWMSKPIEWIFDLSNRPLMICDTIDVQYIRESRLEEYRMEDRFDFSAEKSLELAYLEKYDIALAITCSDAEELERNLSTTEVCTLEIEASIPKSQVLDAKSYDERCESICHKYDLVFAGADNEANRYALVILINEIVPELAKRKIDLKVGIAGHICESLPAKKDSI